MVKGKTRTKKSENKPFQYLFELKGNMIVLRFYDFTFERKLRDFIADALRKNHFHTETEKSITRGRPDIFAYRNNEEIYIECKNFNRVNGFVVKTLSTQLEAFWQLFNYLQGIKKDNRIIKGLIVTSRIPSPVLLKVVGSLNAFVKEKYDKMRFCNKTIIIERNKIFGVGFLVPTNPYCTSCGLYVTHNRGWKGGYFLFNVNISDISMKPKICKIELTQEQLFDFIFYYLYLQDVHEWKAVGFSEEIIATLLNEAKRRGYHIVNNTKAIKEPWNKTFIYPGDIHKILDCY